MTLLFQRRARVVVDTIELLIGKNQLDVSFKVLSTLKPEPNTAEIQIINLNRNHRAQLEHSKVISCTIEAGYKEQTQLIFSGTLMDIVSKSNGPDITTVLQSGDGSKNYQESRVNVSIAPKTGNLSIVQQIIKSLGIQEGNLSSVGPSINSIPPILPQGGILSGSSSQILTRILRSLGFEWSIQNGTIQILQVGVPTNQLAVLLTSDTGLIGSPSIDKDGFLSARCLMIPDVFPGRLMQFKSLHFEGNFRIQSCSYQGSTFGDDWYIDIEAKRL